MASNIDKPAFLLKIFDHSITQDKQHRERLSEWKRIFTDVEASSSQNSASSQSGGDEAVTHNNIRFAQGVYSSKDNTPAVIKVQTHHTGAISSGAPLNSETLHERQKQQNVQLPNQIANKINAATLDITDTTLSTERSRNSGIIPVSLQVKARNLVTQFMELPQISTLAQHPVLQHLKIMDAERTQPALTKPNPSVAISSSTRESVIHAIKAITLTVTETTQKAKSMASNLFSGVSRVKQRAEELITRMYASNEKNMTITKPETNAGTAKLNVSGNNVAADAKLVASTKTAARSTLGDEFSHILLEKIQRRRTNQSSEGPTGVLGMTDPTNRVTSNVKSRADSSNLLNANSVGTNRTSDSPRSGYESVRMSTGKPAAAPNHAAESPGKELPRAPNSRHGINPAGSDKTLNQPAAEYSVEKSRGRSVKEIATERVGQLKQNGRQEATLRTSNSGESTAKPLEHTHLPRVNSKVKPKTEEIQIQPTELIASSPLQNMAHRATSVSNSAKQNVIETISMHFSSSTSEKAQQALPKFYETTQTQHQKALVNGVKPPTPDASVTIMMTDKAFPFLSVTIQKTTNRTVLRMRVAQSESDNLDELKRSMKDEISKAIGKPIDLELEC